MGQIITNEEVLENIKKGCTLYGNKKGEKYFTNFVESEEIVNYLGEPVKKGKNTDSEKYPLERNYYIYKGLDKVYRRIETLNIAALTGGGIIKYDVFEWAYDQVGMVRFDSTRDHDWHYIYNYSDELHYKDSIKVVTINQSCYYYRVEGNIFKSNDGLICFDTQTHELFLNYGGRTFELDSTGNIVSQVSDNTIGMPDNLNRRLNGDYKSMYTLSYIFYYYDKYLKFIKDLPRIQGEVDELNSLSLEEAKEEISVEVSKTPVKRKLTRKQKKKNQKNISL